MANGAVATAIGHVVFSFFSCFLTRVVSFARSRSFLSLPSSRHFNNIVS
jgi:hypothetical protein